tara:strand:+ start:6951 stop:7289 length:339 start_codon:yes stop_codon:yes gene_type:complete
MGMKLINSEYDSFTGITEEFWYDDLTNKVTIRRLQDVQEQLDFNKQCYNNHSGIGYQDSEGGAHHVARIPLVVIERWKTEEGFDWFNSTDKERRAKLNDPDNRFLLVRPGKL